MRIKCPHCGSYFNKYSALTTCPNCDYAKRRSSDDDTQPSISISTPSIDFGSSASVDTGSSSGSDPFSGGGGSFDGGGSSGSW